MTRSARRPTTHTGLIGAPGTSEPKGSREIDAGRMEVLPDSVGKKFAWESGRIAHELVCKFDQFTRRREDHMRKLLWTFGSDPCFESANKNAIHVSPSNFNRVCDRFGLVCDEGQAKEIFASHNLPSDGCNLCA